MGRSFQEQEADDLAIVFREAIRSRYGNQAKLAAELEVNPSLLSDYLNGKRPIPWNTLVQLAHRVETPLETAVAAANLVRAKREASNPWTADEKAVITVLAKRLADLYDDRSRTRGVGHRTLGDFPRCAAGEWRVVMGDRRESIPQGLGDILALSLSTSDVMFLPQVSLPPGTRVLSDKIFRIADESSLRRLFRGNLLVIGSPAVCLGTREILRRVGATFLFNIGGDDFRLESGILEEVCDDERHDSQALGRFMDRPEIRRATNSLLATYRSNGFVDPIDYEDLRGRAIPRNVDYGLVALAPNPWSEEHLAVICAGVHGPGTAGALQMLSRPDVFEDRPWGGVLRVQVSDQARWEDRFSHLNPRWETHPYSPDSYLKAMCALRQSLESAGGESVRPRVKVDPEKLSAVEKFVRDRLQARDSSQQ